MGGLPKMLMRTWRPNTTFATVLRQPQILTMWVCVNAMDVILTLYLLDLGGKEGNPFLAALQEPLGTSGMLGAKLAIAAIVGLVIWRFERRPVLLAAAVAMGLVVMWNSFMVAYTHLVAGGTLAFA